VSSILSNMKVEGKPNLNLPGEQKGIDLTTLFKTVAGSTTVSPHRPSRKKVEKKPSGAMETIKNSIISQFNTITEVTKAPREISEFSNIKT
jgi:hypothetical protein